MNSSTTTINYAEVLQGISKKRLLPYNSTFAISPKKPELTMFSYTAHQDIATNLCYVLHLVEINLRNNLNDNFKAFVQKIKNARTVGTTGLGEVFLRRYM